MRMKLHFAKLIYFLIVLSSCSDMLSDYEKNDIYPLGVDEKICITLNGKQSINAISFMNEDSLTIENLYDQHSTDTNSFISPSAVSYTHLRAHET